MLLYLLETMMAFLFSPFFIFCILLFILYAYYRTPKGQIFNSKVPGWVPILGHLPVIDVDRMSEQLEAWTYE